MAQRLGDQHTALHTARQGDDFRILAAPQRQVTQGALDECRVGLFAEQATAERDRIPDGLERVGGQFLGDESDFCAGFAIVADDIVAACRDSPRCRTDDTADDADQRSERRL